MRRHTGSSQQRETATERDINMCVACGMLSLRSPSQATSGRSKRDTPCGALSPLRRARRRRRRRHRGCPAGAGTASPEAGKAASCNILCVADESVSSGLGAAHHRDYGRVRWEEGISHKVGVSSAERDRPHRSGRNLSLRRSGNERLKRLEIAFSGHQRWLDGARCGCHCTPPKGDGPGR